MLILPNIRARAETSYQIDMKSQDSLSEQWLISRPKKILSSIKSQRLSKAIDC
jgi:hypothetical protein